MKFSIDLPLPPRELSPNVRCHHMAKARQVKMYRHMSWMMTMAQLNKLIIEGRLPGKPLYTKATCQVTYRNSTRRTIDSDNIIAALKSAFDGLTDAGLIADDVGLTHLPPIRTHDKLNPGVTLEVEGFE